MSEENNKKVVWWHETIILDIHRSVKVQWKTNSFLGGFLGNISTIRRPTHWLHEIFFKSSCVKLSCIFLSGAISLHYKKKLILAAGCVNYY